MLKLKNIVKEYPTGDSKVVALKGVSIEFRKSNSSRSLATPAAARRRC